MSVWQQWNQLELDFGELGSARRDPSSETFIALRLAESPTGEIRLMESICERQNMHRAMRQVRRNGGAPGIDGMTVEQLPGYLRKHWWKIKADLMAGRYRPLPVRRKEIDKPDGGVRLLGIPTVLDRLIQQATAQVLTAIWESTFSEYSFGFRPERSQHDAIRQCKRYVESGDRYVVELDLEKFFDRVNHDRLMSRLATRVHDKRVLKLIRRFLTCGVLIGGLQSPTVEGTPQGGQMSLAQPDTAQKDDIGVVGKEGEAEEILHLSTVDLAGPSPVKRFECFDSGKVSGLNPPLNPVFASAMTFAFQKAGEVFDVGPMLFGGLGG